MNAQFQRHPFECSFLISPMILFLNSLFDSFLIFFSRWILIIKRILLAFLFLFDAEHICMFYLQGFNSSEKYFRLTTISNINTENTISIAKLFINVSLDHDCHIQSMKYVKRAISTLECYGSDGRRGFDVAGKVVFVLWCHDQRRTCNGTMPTMKLALLCLLLQGSAQVPCANNLC